MAKKKKGGLLKALRQRGSVGNLVVIGVMAGLIGFGAAAIDGVNPPTPPSNGEAVKVVSPTPEKDKTNLQLETFGYVTIAPTPTTAISLCTDGSFNEEPGILVAYQPGKGQTVSATGQVKVWVSDENAPFVAPGTKIDSTGKITALGDTSAKASDGYLFEPALYIAPKTAESGGTPHFPSYIKGQYNPNPGDFSSGNWNQENGVTGPAIDPLPSDAKTFDTGFNKYMDEYIWDVSSLGLSPGTYQAEFLIHDGDRNRGVGCVNIQIQ